MDLQQILALNVMVISALALAGGLLQGTWRSAGLWLAANALIVATGAVLLQWAPSMAGTIVTILFVPLVLVPALLARLTDSRVQQNRMKDAARFARIASWIHPSPQARLNAAMLEAQASDSLSAQIAAMRHIQTTATPFDRLAIEATVLRLQNKWDELLDLLQANPPLAASSPSLYVRALGENGQIDRMTRVYDDAKSHIQAGELAVTQLFLMAFAGRQGEAEQILSGPLSGLGTDSQTYWRAVASRAAGSAPEHWQPDLVSLAQTGTAQSVRRAAARQLELAQTGTSGPAFLDDISSAILDDAAARLRRTTAQRPARGALTPVTWALLAAIAVGYGLSEMRGGSENLRTLVDLGALWPPYVSERGEWWRLVAPLFLHWGPLHAIINSFMLVVLGRACERSYGSLRMGLIYAIGGIASTTFVWWLAATGRSDMSVLVGASGAIMALFGALAGRSLVIWLRYRDVLDGKNLLMIGVIVALQVAVDLSVPQVSLAAHASGMVAGAIIGALLTMTTEDAVASERI
jgi:rhomboid protease GluP